MSDKTFTFAFKDTEIMDEQAKLTSLRAWIKSNKMRQNAMAKALGVTPTTVNNLLAGRTTFGKLTAEKWSQAFGLNADFLLTGKGELKIREKTIEETVADYMRRHNAHEVALACIRVMLKMSGSGDIGWQFLAAEAGIGLVGISPLSDFRKRFEAWYTAGCPYV